ncbi:MAG: hypothetical protein M3M99_05820, partial [Actinomycetota bacterium]|nr:hypothetical protein [Actinomycetota bacterium]
MGNELQASELVIEAEPARPLARRDRGTIEVLGREVGPVAIAATAGAAAGVAAVAAVRAAHHG